MRNGRNKVKGRLVDWLKSIGAAVVVTALFFGVIYLVSVSPVWVGGMITASIVVAGLTAIFHEVMGW